MSPDLAAAFQHGPEFLSGLAIFELARCNLGLDSPTTCTYLTPELGGGFLVAGLLGTYLTVYVTPPMVVGGLIAEWVARRR